MIARAEPPVTPRSPPMEALTGLRFVAAIYVVVSHFHPAFGRDRLNALFGFSQVAVTTFFVLSGFLMVVNYRAPGPARVTRRRFLLARFARIYPLYALAWVLVLLFVVVVRPDRPGFGVEEGVTSALLVSAWSAKDALGWNLPGWSICAEVLFYAVFAAFFLAPRATEKSRPSPSPGTALAGVAVCWALRLVLVAVALAVHPGLRTASWQLQGEYPLAGMPVAYSPLFRLPEFVAGICVGYMHLAPPGKLRAWLGGPAGLLASAVPVGATMLAWPPGLLHVHLFVEVLAPALLLPFVAALVWHLALGRGVAARVLALRPSVFLGEVSYGIYLLQFPVWLYFKAVTHAPLSSSMTMRSLVAFVAVLLVVSSVSFVAIERPARRAVLRAADRARPR